MAADLFEWRKGTYLLLVDYYSRYIEVIKCISSTTSAAIIGSIKSIFSRHGIPEELVFDNGPQFSAEEFKKIAKKYTVRISPQAK